MPGKMRRRRLVDASSRVDVHRVGDLVRGLAVRRQILRLILSCGREQKAAVRSEGQPPEERGEGLVCV